MFRFKLFLILSVLSAPCLGMRSSSKIAGRLVQPAIRAGAQAGVQRSAGALSGGALSRMPAAGSRFHVMSPVKKRSFSILPYNFPETYESLRGVGEKHLETIETDKLIDMTVNGDDIALFMLAGQGKVDIIKDLVSQGAIDLNNFNAKGVKDGAAILMTAAGFEHPEAPVIIKSLIDAGANPDYAPKRGFSPLMFAAAFGKADAVRALIRSGADVTLKNEDGWTALDLAKIYSKNDVIKVFAEEDSSLKDNALEHLGLIEETVLLREKLNNSMETYNAMKERKKAEKIAAQEVQASQDAQVAPEALNQERLANTPVMDQTDADLLAANIAAREAQEVQEALSQEPLALKPVAEQAAEENIAEQQQVSDSSKKEDDDYRRSKKWAAGGLVGATGGVLAAAVYYLEAKDKDGLTPLQQAVLVNNTQLIKLLLGAGADLDTKDKHGHAPLHNAVMLLITDRNNKTEAIELLIDKGANLEAKDELGNTPLHYLAVAPNSSEAINLFLGKGANLEATDNNGNTPLHLAAKENDSEEIIKLLLGKGANLKAKNNDGDTPLDLATKLNKVEVVQILSEAKY